MLEKPEILDIGCGTGVPTLLLAEKFNGHITATDSDTKSINRLEEKNELPHAKAFRLGSNSLREEGYLNYSKVKNLFAASGRGINP